MLFFFFFQAEDGIRDLYVTGVQTCALPISSTPPTRTRRPRTTGSSTAAGSSGTASSRSEERRVGKECRFRWAPDHEKKKTDRRLVVVTDHTKWGIIGISSIARLNDADTLVFFFSSRRRHTRSLRDWSSDVCSSD